MTHVVRPSTLPTTVTTASPGEAVVGPGEQPVLEVRLVVEQQAQAVADQQLALVDDPLAGLLRAAEAGGLGAPPQLVVRARRTVCIESATFRRARRPSSRRGHLQEERAGERHHGLARAGCARRSRARRRRDRASRSAGDSRTTTSAWIVSPNRTGSGRRTSSRPSQASTQSPKIPVRVASPRARARVSGPWAMRSPNSVAAAYSASTCSGTQSPVSPAQSTTCVSVTVIDSVR